MTGSIPKDMHGMEITTNSGKSVHDTKQLSGEATGADLHGQNSLKEHNSGKAVMGHGKGATPYARK